MSRASNSLRTSDVLTTPIKLKYTASFDSASIEQVGIEVYTGVNEPIGAIIANSKEALLYRSVKHLYYSNYLTGSVPVSASYADNWLQSTAASGTLEADRRYFPTGSYDIVQILSIPRELYGERIAKKSFKFTSNNCNIVDDGNGNLVDTVASVHVGNIIYAQGMVLITNQDYIAILGNVVYLLQEDDSYLLLEDSNKIII
jgi:hypothetical protein